MANLRQEHEQATQTTRLIEQSGDTTELIALAFDGLSKLLLAILLELRDAREESTEA